MYSLGYTDSYKILEQLNRSFRDENEINSVVFLKFSENMKYGKYNIYFDHQYNGNIVAKINTGNFFTQNYVKINMN